MLYRSLHIALLTGILITLLLIWARIPTNSSVVVPILPDPLPVEIQNSSLSVDIDEPLEVTIDGTNGVVPVLITR